MHEAPAIAGSGEGSMYAALSPHAKRLFPLFEPGACRSQLNTLADTLKHNLIHNKAHNTTSDCESY